MGVGLLKLIIIWNEDKKKKINYLLGFYGACLIIGWYVTNNFNATPRFNTLSKFKSSNWPHATNCTKIYF